MWKQALLVVLLVAVSTATAKTCHANLSPSNAVLLGCDVVDGIIVNELLTDFSATPDYDGVNTEILYAGGITSVAGIHLTTGPGSDIQIHFPDLVTVEGDVLIGTGYHTVSADLVEEVRSFVVVDTAAGDNLNAISFAGLTTIRQHLFVSTFALTSLSMDALVWAGTDVMHAPAGSTAITLNLIDLSASVSLSFQAVDAALGAATTTTTGGAMNSISTTMATTSSFMATAVTFINGVAGSFGRGVGGDYSIDFELAMGSSDIFTVDHSWTAGDEGLEDVPFGWMFYIRDNGDAMTSVSFASLETAQMINLAQVRVATSIDFTSLEWAMDLIVRDAWAVTSLDFPALERVTRNLHFQMRARTVDTIKGALGVPMVVYDMCASVDLSSLIYVGYDMVITKLTNVGFTSLSLDSLSWVGRDLELTFLDHVENIWAPELESVGRSMQLEFNVLVEELNFDKLETVYDLSVRHNRNLHNLTLIDLRWVNSLVIDGNERLSWTYAPRLTTVDGYLVIANTDATTVGTLQTLSASFADLTSVGVLQITDNTVSLFLWVPSLVNATGIVVMNNNLVPGGASSPYANPMAEIVFPSLEWAGFIEMSGNPALENVQFPSLTTVFQITLSGNEKLESVGLRWLARVGSDSFSAFAAAATAGMTDFPVPAPFPSGFVLTGTFGDIEIDSDSLASIYVDVASAGSMPVIDGAVTIDATGGSGCCIDPMEEETSSLDYPFLAAAGGVTCMPVVPDATGCPAVLTTTCISPVGFWVPPGYCEDQHCAFEAGDYRGSYDEAADQCLCDSGFASSFDSEERLCNVRASQDCFDGDSAEFEVYLAEEIQGLFGFIVVTLRSPIDSEGRVVSITIGAIGAMESNDCSMPGPYWRKSFDSSECEDIYQAEFPMSLLADCGIAPEETSIILEDGFVLTRDAMPVKWNKYTFEIITTAVSIAGSFALDPEVELEENRIHVARTVVYVPIEFLIQFDGELEVTSDHGLEARIIEQQWNPATSPNDPMTATLVVRTVLRWPYTVTDAVSTSTPDELIVVSLEQRSIDPADIDGQTPCGEDVGDICMQDWVVTIYPTAICSVDGDYSFGFTLGCRDEDSFVFFGTACVTEEAEIVLQDLDGTDICSTVFVNEETVLTTSLEVYSDAGFTEPENEFYLGRWAYFSLDVSSTGFQVEQVSVNYAVAMLASATTPQSIPLDKEILSLGVLGAPATFRVYLIAAAFPELVEGSTESYFITVAATITYVDGSKARTLRSTDTLITPRVELLLNNDGTASSVTSPSSVGGMSVGSTVGIIGGALLAAVVVVAVVVVAKGGFKTHRNNTKHFESGKALDTATSSSDVYYYNETGSSAASTASGSSSSADGVSSTFGTF